MEENLNLKEHIKYIENKLAKNLTLLKEARPILEKNAVLAFYYPYIHNYFNYANIAWGNARRTNLKKVNSQQNKNMSYLYFEQRQTCPHEGNS